MKIAVTGINGQVARSITERAHRWEDIEIVNLGRPELDLLDADSIHRAIGRAKPDIVVSAAAFTQVEKAEDDHEAAHLINCVGAGEIARAAFEAGCPIIHISTDYIFGGDKLGPYVETDPPGPLNVYGRTKLAGEAAVAKANPRHAILRTSWIYSPFGRNFVTTMLQLATEREVLDIVCDQWGCPTSARDVADGVLTVAATGLTESSQIGLFHLAGSGVTNWSGFARRIFEDSREFGGPSATVNDIASSAYPSRVLRPANSALSTEKFYRAFQWRPPAWQDACADAVAQILSWQQK